MSGTSLVSTVCILHLLMANKTDCTKMTVCPSLVSRLSPAFFSLLVLFLTFSLPLSLSLPLSPSTLHLSLSLPSPTGSPSSPPPSLPPSQTPPSLSLSLSSPPPPSLSLFFLTPPPLSLSLHLHLFIYVMFFLQDTAVSKHFVALSTNGVSCLWLITFRQNWKRQGVGGWGGGGAA